MKSSLRKYPYITKLRNISQNNNTQMGYCIKFISKVEIIKIQNKC